jgi:GR25 family glycosyltransferase involved in LPS biosynthesis
MQSYVITLFEHENSQRLLQDCLASCREWGWSAEPFPATVGSAVTAQDYISAGLYLNPSTKIYQRLGAQGCFFSHWRLWHKCREMNEPIIVLETDAVVQGPQPAVDLSKGIQKFHRDRGTKTGTTGTWSKGTHAYALSPAHAAALIEGIRATEVKPSDKCIGTQFVAWQHWDWNLVELNTRRGPSTTAKPFRINT